jgi:UDP-2-acetamido-2,6-beta-L-arabino-hexul-4-ose reductase
VTIFRLTNVFGKWCRPNYNSVVATFCYNVARDLPIAISDPNHVISLVHVDDVVQALLDGARASTSPGAHYREVEPVYDISLEMLAEALKEFRTARDTLLVPNLGDPLMQRLYSTYLSYLPEDQFAYDLEQRSDPRGSLAEFVKSEPFGQIFVSRTNPGITRGNHYHHIKSEKFLVLEGEAIVRFRHILHDTVLEYPVNGKAFRVIDIPPGYTHSIENVGASELVTLFWASEIFDSAHPDTNYMDVLSTL